MSPDTHDPTMTISRRAALGSAVKLAAGGALAAAWLRGGLLEALAQAQGTAAASAVAGYPELTVTITDQEVQASPTEIPAGYVLLTVVNNSSDESSAGLFGPGEGHTMEEMQQSAATPVAEDTGFPPFIYTAVIAGGPGTMQPGDTGQAIIEVKEGQWAVGAEGSQPPVMVTATASTGASQAEPDAVITITEVDFAFGGFVDALPAGQQTWKVVNEGTEPHMLVLGQVPAGTTVAQVLEASGRSPQDPVPAGGLKIEDFHAVSPGGVFLQSTGVTVWPILDLSAGHYAAMCFVPDPAHGNMPHAMEGMVAVFDVGTGEATPAG